MIRIEGKTAYASTVKEAFDATDLAGIENVVIEDNAERIKMQRLLKGFRACPAAR